MTTIHHMPEAEYHACQSIGSTTAKLALKSMQLYSDRVSGIAPSEDRGYFQIGRLMHMQRLEPERFAELTTDRGPLNEKTGRSYGRDTKAFAEWQAAHPEITVVEPWLYLAFERCPDAVSALFEGGESEVSAFVRAGKLDVLVKCRCDYLRGTEIIDLKSCTDVDDAERQIRRLGYWFSAAWYRMVMKEVTGKTHSHRFVFVEKRAPYRWRIVDLAADYAMYGDAMVERVLGDIHTAHQTGDWADKGELEIMVSMPDYFDDSEDANEGEI